MGLVHIFERGGEDVERFEAAMYDIKDAIDEICEIYEKMKSEYGERRSSGRSTGYSSRSVSGHDQAVYGERRMHR